MHKLYFHYNLKQKSKIEKYLYKSEFFLHLLSGQFKVFFRIIL